MENLKEFKKKVKNLNYRDMIIDIFYIVIGAYLISFSISVFLLPHKLSTGGASGIATILYYISNIPMGVTVMLINIPLFIMALVKLGIKFSGKAILTTVVMSIFLDNIDYTKLVNILSTDLFISSIFGGIIMGLGLSVLFKAGASSGGSDLLAQLIYRLTNIQSLSQILLIIDTIIITSIVIVFKNVNLGLYSIVSIFVSKKVIDIVFEGIYYTKIVNIITLKPDDIITEILEELNRSATINKVMGAYTKEEYTSMTVILTLPELSKLKRIIRQIDEHALVYISDANEVIGHGFKAM